MENAITHFSIRYRWTLLLLTLLLTAFAGYGMQYFVFNGSPRAFFADDDPHMNALLKIEEEYGRVNNAILMVGPKPGIDPAARPHGVFNREDLLALEELTRRSWQLPNIKRVQALTNFQYTHAEDDELIVSDLIENSADMTEQQIRRIQQIALAEPVLINRHITPDSQYAGMVLSFNLHEDDMAQATVTGDSIMALVKQFEADYPQLELWASGTVVSEYVNMNLIVEDTGAVIGLMYLIMFVLLSVMLRSVLAMLSIIAVTSIGSTIALGLSCWLGVVFTSMTMSAMTIIITVTIAHCVHILALYLQLYRDGQSRESALRESLRVNLQPVFLTSLTTAIGFLSMNFSEIRPAHDLGNVSALGVLAAFVCSLTVLPALLLVLPINRNTQSSSVWQQRMDNLAQFIIKRRSPLLIITLLVSVTGSWLAFQNIINDDMSRSLTEGHPFRIDNEFIDEKFGGLYNIQLSVHAEEAGGISDPEYLQQLDKFTEWLRQQPDVINVFSYSDVIKRLNRNMHNDDVNYYRIPENRELAAQYLLLYEMSLPYGMELTNQIDLEKSATRLVVTLPSADTQELLGLQKRINEWQALNLPEHMRHTGTSYSVIWAYLSINALMSSVKSAVIALTLISIILILVLGSVRFGLISLLPNLLPAALGFGFWNLYSGELNMGLFMVMTITIGIVVDDTVHFLSKYQRALRENNHDSEKAVQVAFHYVGPALFITTLVLICGFAAMMLSQFYSNASMGLMTAVVLLSAILLDFFMLPPLLLALDKKKKQAQVDKA